MVARQCPVCGRPLCLVLVRNKDGQLEQAFIHLYDCEYVRKLENKVRELTLKQEKGR